jgi:hypothetical protein
MIATRQDSAVENNPPPPYDAPDTKANHDLAGSIWRLDDDIKQTAPHNKKSNTRQKIERDSALALKGHNMSAQGNALGKPWPQMYRAL